MLDGHRRVVFLFAHTHVYDRDAVAITRGGIAVVMHHRPPWTGELAPLEKC